MDKKLDKSDKSNTIVYTGSLSKAPSSKIRWGQLKSSRLKRIRGVSFEEILEAPLLGVVQHPCRPGQEILVFEHKGYTWAVPFVSDSEGIFLKTLYPSRKYRKLYKKR